MEIYKKEWGDPEDPDGTAIDADVLADGSMSSQRLALFFLGLLNRSP